MYLIPARNDVSASLRGAWKSAPTLIGFEKLLLILHMQDQYENYKTEICPLESSRQCSSPNSRHCISQQGEGGIICKILAINFL